MTYKPPFSITPKILSLSQSVFHELGTLSGAKLDSAPVRLRRENKIKTIQSSLAIEGNTLSLDQVSDLFDGKKVIGPKKDILEVKNALELYNNLHNLNPLSQKDILTAHELLVKDIEKEAGMWRSGNVGVFKGKELAHMAPPSKKVPGLMSDLFDYISKDTEVSWLLKGCVFHYEFEFIHPFSDGNGRIGRLWQQLLLMKESPVFEYISVEALIKENQRDYYDVLGICDAEGNSTKFIEFSLSLILLALKELNKASTYTLKDAASRLTYASTKLQNQYFSRKVYLEIHKDISSATASRDLLYGLNNALLTKKGENNQIVYRFL